MPGDCCVYVFTQTWLGIGQGFGDVTPLAILKRRKVLATESKDEATCSLATESTSSSAGAASSPESKKFMKMVTLQKLASAVGKTGSDSVMEDMQTVAAVSEANESKGEKTSPKKKKRGEPARLLVRPQ